MASGVPNHRHDCVSACLCRVPRGGGKRPRHRNRHCEADAASDLSLAGRMDTELRGAQLAHRWMLDTVARNAPSADTVNEVMIGRSLVATHAIAAVELAMELAGGASFYRAAGLERRLRRAFLCATVRTTGALRGSDSARLADIQRVLTNIPGWIVPAEDDTPVSHLDGRCDSRRGRFSSQALEPVERHRPAHHVDGIVDSVPTEIE